MKNVERNTNPTGEINGEKGLLLGCATLVLPIILMAAGALAGSISVPEQQTVLRYLATGAGGILGFIGGTIAMVVINKEIQNSTIL